MSEEYTRRYKAIMCNNVLFVSPADEYYAHNDIMQKMVIPHFATTPDGIKQFCHDVDNDRIPIEFGYSWGAPDFSVCETYTLGERKAWYIKSTISRIEKGVAL